METELSIETFAAHLSALVSFSKMLDAAPKVGECGWLAPYLVMLDEAHLGGRYSWWTRALLDGRLPDSPIPRLEFKSNASGEVMKNIHDTMKPVASTYGQWEAIRWFVRELTFGLGFAGPVSHQLDDDMTAKYREHFCATFGLHLMTAHPYDHLGDLIAESKSGGGKFSNPTAFFPTPMPLCVLSVGVLFDDDGDDWKSVAVKTAHDPCLGTGRYLLAASNHCLQLSGQDIDPFVIEVAKINAALYAPWMLRPGTGKVREIDEYNARDDKPYEQRTIGQLSLF